MSCSICYGILQFNCFQKYTLTFLQINNGKTNIHNNPSFGLKILENIYNMHNALELWKMNIIIFHLFKDFTLTMKSRSKFKSIPSCKALNDEWHIYFTRKVLLHWNQRLIIQFIIHERNVLLDKSQRIFQIDEKTFIFYFGLHSSLNYLLHIKKRNNLHKIHEYTYITILIRIDMLRTYKCAFIHSHTPFLWV